METRFKVGDRVVIEFDGHKTPGTIMQRNSYDESFVETTTGGSWYDNSRLTLRGKQKRNTITQKDIEGLIRLTMQDVCWRTRGSEDYVIETEIPNIYNQWKTNLKLKNKFNPQ